MSPILNKILKIAGIFIGLLAVLILVLAFTVNPDFEMERSIVIDKPNEEVFDYVKYLRNQYNYSVWGTLDPDMKQEFRGTDGTVGFVSVWEGNEDAGAGEQEIIGMVEGERIDYELRFLEPFETTSYAFMSTEPISENQTRVTWGMFGSFSRPMNIMLLFFDLEEAIGNDYEIGLNNLKVLLEESDTDEESE
ncbi:MAG: SRPBCC family protein [Balneolaceae bacterium]|nr:SRPBCC family protein [Balneolaceae bacterium]